MLATILSLGWLIGCIYFFRNYGWANWRPWAFMFGVAYAINPLVTDSGGDDSYTTSYPPGGPDACDCFNNVRYAEYFDPYLQQACETYSSTLTEMEKFNWIGEAQEKGCISYKDFD